MHFHIIDRLPDYTQGKRKTYNVSKLVQLSLVVSCFELHGQDLLFWELHVCAYVQFVGVLVVRFLYPQQCYAIWTLGFEECDNLLVNSYFLLNDSRISLTKLSQINIGLKSPTEAARNFCRRLLPPKLKIQVPTIIPIQLLLGDLRLLDSHTLIGFLVGLLRIFTLQYRGRRLRIKVGSTLDQWGVLYCIEEPKGDDGIGFWGASGLALLTDDDDCFWDFLLVGSVRHQLMQVRIISLTWENLSGLIFSISLIMVLVLSRIQLIILASQFLVILKSRIIRSILQT